MDLLAQFDAIAATPGAPKKGKSKSAPSKRKVVEDEDEDAGSGAESGSDSGGSGGGRAKSTFGGDADDQNLSEDDDDIAARKRDIRAKQAAAERAKGKAQAKPKPVSKPKPKAAAEESDEPPAPKKKAPVTKKPAPKKPAPAEESDETPKAAAKKSKAKPKQAEPSDDEDEAPAPKKSQKRKREEADSSQEAEKSETEKKVPAKKGKGKDGAPIAKSKKSSSAAAANEKKSKKPADSSAESDAERPAKKGSKKGSEAKKPAPKSKKAQEEAEEEPAAAATATSGKAAAAQALLQVQKVLRHMCVEKHPLVLKRHKNGLMHPQREGDLTPECTLSQSLRDRLAEDRIAVDSAKWYISDVKAAGKLGKLVLKSDTGETSAAVDLGINNDARRIGTLGKHATIHDKDVQAKDRNAFVKARDTVDTAALNAATRYVAMGQNVLFITGGSMGIHHTHAVLDKNGAERGERVEYTPGMELLYGGPVGKKSRHMSQADLEIRVVFMFDSIHRIIEAFANQKGFSKHTEAKQWSLIREYMEETLHFSGPLQLYLIMLWKDFSGPRNTGPLSNVLDDPRNAPSAVWTQYLYALHWDPQAVVFYKECVDKMKASEAQEGAGGEDEEDEQEEAQEHAEVEAEAEPEPEAQPEIEQEEAHEPEAPVPEEDAEAPVPEGGLEEISAPLDADVASQQFASSSLGVEHPDVPMAEAEEHALVE